VSILAGPTGFEPAISSVTGRRDRPLHYEPRSVGKNGLRQCNRGNHSNSPTKKQTKLLGFDVVVGWFFGLQGFGVGGDRLEVELDVGAMNVAAAGIDKFDNVQGVTGVYDA
jgi:hypothetical protein